VSEKFDLTPQNVDLDNKPGNLQSYSEEASTVKVHGKLSSYTMTPKIATKV
jgi:hypothetical protein